MCGQWHPDTHVQVLNHPTVLPAQAEMYENRLSLSGRAGVDMRNHLQPRPTPCSYCLYHGDVAASQPQLMVSGSESLWFLVCERDGSLCPHRRVKGTAGSGWIANDQCVIIALCNGV